ncbi:MAG: VOC family protein [Chitinophagaceae bacterium]|nr:VOC family protein [Chitinophagaceae bacterium]
MAAVNPYLTFNGNCGEAFDFYKSVFGGAFVMKSRFKDIPSENKMSETEGEKIMHVSLPIGKTILMGSDRSEFHGEGIMGNNFSISINTDSEEEATKIFNGLSAGGQVTMPLEKTFWNAYFGMLTDKYDVQWMVNYDYK